MGVPLCWGRATAKTWEGQHSDGHPVLEKKLRESSFSLPEEFKP
jgi:hypothetical protein